MTKQTCTERHYVVIMEGHKDVDVYQRDTAECPICLERIADGLFALAEIFRSRLAALAPIKKCRVYDTACINPSYCDARDACCAGDPDCRAVCDPR